MPILPAETKYYSSYMRLVESELISATVANDSYDFKVSTLSPRNNIVELFYFTDFQGNKTDATAGTVNILFSSGKEIYQTIDDGQFQATSATSEDRTKPTGLGKVESVRITLNGVTGPATGFYCLLSQTSL